MCAATSHLHQPLASPNIFVLLFLWSDRSYSSKLWLMQAVFSCGKVSTGERSRCTPYRTRDTARSTRAHSQGPSGQLGSRKPV
ncbi:hypothetical protein BKA83DRAFT_4292920 [Pisolithus microcarpus]|nr:hypothetical protein BKA83DRAFT_4292920 [Pisolithus microcarpus]